MSDERVLLLSEIEQRAKFIFVDTNDVPAFKKLDESNFQNNLACYVLWDLRTNCRQSTSQLRDEVTMLLVESRRSADSSVLASSSLLAVEVLVDKNTEGSAGSGVCADIRLQIQENIEWIKENHHVGCVFVGVSDNPVGDPALEAILDYVSIVSQHISTCHSTYPSMMLPTQPTTTPHEVRVAAIHQSHLLGHDCTRDQDHSVSKGHFVECIFSANTQPNEHVIASSIKQWLKGLGLGPARNNFGSCMLTKKKKRQSNDDDNYESTVVWGVGDSIISIVLISCVLAWAFSYFLSKSV